MLIFSIVLNLVFLVLLGFAIVYLIKFARIIMSVEDNLNQAIENLLNTEESLDNLLAMQLFFESKEVQVEVKKALDDVKLSKVGVSMVIKDFTRLSRQKYEMVEMNENNEEPQLSDNF